MWQRLFLIIILWEHQEQSSCNCMMRCLTPLCLRRVTYYENNRRNSRHKLHFFHLMHPTFTDYLNDNKLIFFQLDSCNHFLSFKLVMLFCLQFLEFYCKYTNKKIAVTCWNHESFTIPSKPLIDQNGLLVLL